MRALASPSWPRRVERHAVDLDDAGVYAIKFGHRNRHFHAARVVGVGSCRVAGTDEHVARHPQCH
eukprot:6085572-Lingulodinium_polyedra.AAC.1